MGAREMITSALGIDPGGTTGIVIVRVNPLRIHLQARLDPVEFRNQIRSLVTQVDAVAIEKYDINAGTVKKTRQYDALYHIGSTLQVCHEEFVNLSLQSRSDAKPAFVDAVLKEYGLWTTSPHTRDATRHALLLLRRAGHKL